MQAFEKIDHTMSKTEKYKSLFRQAEALLSDETDMTANMANMTALLKDTFGWFWIGFYRVDTQTNQLILAPFQGTLACTRIDFGKGVCGEAWATGMTQVVADVHAHPNHIACSSLSNSEIVVPVRNAEGDIVAVLDIDSTEYDTFDDIDAEQLEKLVKLFV